MVYWYLGGISQTLVRTLNRLMQLFEHEEGDAPPKLILVLREWGDTIGNVAQGMRDVCDISQKSICFALYLTVSLISLQILHNAPPTKIQIPATQEKTTFTKRFKWAFEAGYAEASMTDEDKPTFEEWSAWKAQQNDGDVRRSLP